MVACYEVVYCENEILIRRFMKKHGDVECGIGFKKSRYGND